MARRKALWERWLTHFPMLFPMLPAPVKSGMLLCPIDSGRAILCIRSFCLLRLFVAVFPHEFGQPLTLIFNRRISVSGLFPMLSASAAPRPMALVSARLQL